MLYCPHDHILKNLLQHRPPLLGPALPPGFKRQEEDEEKDIKQYQKQNRSPER